MERGKADVESNYQQDSRQVNGWARVGVLTWGHLCVMIITVETCPTLPGQQAGGGGSRVSDGSAHFFLISLQTETGLGLM